jgi:hypothetical protein
MAKKGERDPERERFWRAAFKRRQGSGLSTKEFCRQEGLSEASYYAWRRELARRDRRRPRQPRSGRKRASGAASSVSKRGRQVAAAPLFQELAILGGPSPVAGGCLEIILPDGCRVRLASEVDRALLADVLRALEGRRC